MRVLFGKHDHAELHVSDAFLHEWEAALQSLSTDTDFRSEVSITFVAAAPMKDQPEESWTVYLKGTPGENKALLAHPEPGERVATLLLSSELLTLSQDLFQKRQNFTLNTLRPFNRFSNLKVHFIFS